ncbi:hypothetical protein D3C80_1483140 [compost metagenome]
MHLSRGKGTGWHGITRCGNLTSGIAYHQRYAARLAVHSEVAAIVITVKGHLKALPVWGCRINPDQHAIHQADGKIFIWPATIPDQLADREGVHYQSLVTVPDFNCTRRFNNGAFHADAPLPQHISGKCTPGERQGTTHQQGRHHTR